MKLAMAAVALAAVTGMAMPAAADEGGAAERTPAPADARVYIVSPQDGATVTSPVTVIFGLEGMGVAPAGIQVPNTGHHHLTIDGEIPPLDEPLPGGEKSIHFGGGQTQTTLELEPGEHTLRLVLGDWRHVPHDPPVISEEVTITVE